VDPTTQQAASAAQGVQSGNTELDYADQFQSLFDKGAFNATDEHGKDLSQEQLQQLETDAQGGQQTQQQDQSQQGDKPDQQDDKGQQQQKQDDEGADYDSLDAYLTEQKLDKDSFYSLPVAVKVDGQDQQVPLAELVKGYQLSSASYNRMNELATQRQAFTQEQTQVRQALGVRIQQTEQLLQQAQQVLLGDYQRVNWQELRSQNPAEYAALSTEFQQRQGALQQQLSQIAQAKQQEAQAAEQARLQAIPQERERLYQARPEWRDPAKAKAAQQAIITAGRQLGFTDAELSQLTDHRHLIVLDLAAQQLKLQASQPSVMKRVRAAPQMAKPGTRQVRDPKRAALNNAREAWARSGFRDEDAAAAAFEQLA